ncbi:serine/threonine-protein kinase [Actinomadura darangshiensis]|uniref:Serine/threonine-protein kinase n=1 Tax=Actinomadura darangshiensis TaxID=705336 RepID=A0A4R5C327_9ACTN|nr:serine/threonine-protein kinase [Actinomadura darangshiensis]TDD92959.1 serine/threonine-protein kinase [Actinomadura darangshiensis]
MSEETMAPLEPEDPREVGGYRLLGRLGAGGMGQVFLGRSASGLTVAVKVIHARYADDPKFRARFRREVGTARAVSGAFTASVIDADADASSPWLVTTFLEGRPLNEAVAEHGPLPPPAVAALGAGLAEALISIHRAGIVHRDLKPHNVMLSPDGPRVIDFGIAHAEDISAITRTGAVIGSPGYMSPEQARGNGTGPPGDVFSLGAVLAFAATGTGPFGRAQMQIMVYRVVHEEPDLGGVTDPRLRSIIAACLDKDPSRRPAPRLLLHWLGTAAPQGVAWLPPPMAASIAQATTQVAVGRKPIGRRVLLSGGAGAVALAATGAVAAAVLDAPEKAKAPDGRLVRTFATGGAVAADPILADAGRRVIVGSDSGRLVAFDTRNGSQIWSYPEKADRQAPFKAAPAGTGPALYAVSGDGRLHAVDAASGRGLWTTTHTDHVTGTVPVLGDRLIFVLTGSTAENKAVNVYDPEGRLKGQIPNVMGAPTAGRSHSGEALVYLSVLGGVAAYDAGTGRLKEQASSQAPISSVLLKGGNGILYGIDIQGQIWAYSPRDNSQIWGPRRPGGSDKALPAGLPEISGSEAYVTDKDGFLYAVDADSEWTAPKWTFRADAPFDTAPRSDGKLVYAVSTDGYLHAVNRVGGKEVWRFRTAGNGRARPVFHGDTVYVGGTNGLHAIRPPA